MPCWIRLLPICVSVQIIQSARQRQGKKGGCIAENIQFVSPSVSLNSRQKLNANTVLSVLDMIYHYSAVMAHGEVNGMPFLSSTGEMMTESKRKNNRTVALYVKLWCSYGSQGSNFEPGSNPASDWCLLQYYNTNPNYNTIKQPY